MRAKVVWQVEHRQQAGAAGAFGQDDPAAVQFRRPAHDGQAQAGAGGLGSRQPAKALEHCLSEFGRDAGAGVLHVQFDAPDGLAAQVLAEAGITRSTIETRILALIKRGAASEEGRIPFTPRAKAAIQSAVTEALQLGHNYVGTEHLLLGLFIDNEAIAAKILVEVGASYDIFKARITEASDSL